MNAGVILKAENIIKQKFIYVFMHTVSTYLP